MYSPPLSENIDFSLMTICSEEYHRNSKYTCFVVCHLFESLWMFRKFSRNLGNKTSWGFVLYCPVRTIVDECDEITKTSYRSNDKKTKWLQGGSTRVLSWHAMICIFELERGGLFKECIASIWYIWKLFSVLVLSKLRFKPFIWLNQGLHDLLTANTRFTRHQITLIQR